MATENQMLANRQNALKSTGPKSRVGKMISSRNSTRHGFYATSVLLPDDDPYEFIRLAPRLGRTTNPKDADRWALWPGRSEGVRVDE